jgi:hypothetical protein
MATYYVRTDGNNGNVGTGPASNQAWQTVTYALANMVLTSGTNYLYIAPGVYREAPTVTITPSSTQTLVISGDPAASQFSGVASGFVRFTNYTSDTANPTNANILTISGKTYITIENIYFELYNTSGSNYCIVGASNPDYITVQKCVFVGQDNASYNANACQISSSTTINQILFDKCVVSRMYVGLLLDSTAASSTSQNFAVTRSLFIHIDIGGVRITGNGIGRTVYNCTFVHTSRNAIAVLSAQASSTGVYNCLFVAGGTALSTSSVGIVENYNRFISCTARTNVSPSGANSVSVGVGGLDYGYGLLTGMANQQFFSTLLGSPNTGFGTSSSAPVSDMYGVTWTGATPDAGSATYRSLSTIGSYNPTERNASTITIAPGSTSQSIELYLGATGLTASTSGLSARYNRTRTASVSIPLVARTIAQAWTSGGFAEVDATNMPGVYRLDIPDAALAAGADDVTIVVRGASGTNGAVMTVKLSSGGLTEAQTASAVWGASVAGYTTATDFGGVVNQIDNSVTGIDAVVQDIPSNVWEELRANHDTAGSFGEYVNAELTTPVSAATSVHIGPYQLLADGLGADQPLDVNVGTATSIDVQVTDANGTGIDISGATVTAKVYSSVGTLVATYSGTATYADNGRLSFGLTTTVTNTSGTYTVTVTRTTGATDTQVFGPLRLYVRPV